MQGCRKDDPILCCPGVSAPLSPAMVLFGSGCFIAPISRYLSGLLPDKQ